MLTIEITWSMWVGHVGRLGAQKVRLPAKGMRDRTGGIDSQRNRRRKWLKSAQPIPVQFLNKTAESAHNITFLASRPQEQGQADLSGLHGRNFFLGTLFLTGVWSKPPRRVFWGAIGAALVGEKSLSSNSPCACLALFRLFCFGRF
jgi:hypothetical protein